jgi:hypothetical protein
MLGDSLFHKGDYQNAAIAYEYAIFKSQNLTQITTLALKKADALIQLGEFNDAFQTLERIDVYAEGDSLAGLVVYKSALTAQLANKPDICLSKLSELKTFAYKDNQLLAKLMEIISLNELRKWDEAHQQFLLFVKEFNLDALDPYLNLADFSMKNPERASNLSYFLPGVGQWYAGNFKKGLISATINGGLIIFSVFNVLNGYYFSAAFTGVSLFYLFYNGGARHAEVLANSYNQQKAQKFNKHVKDLLIQAIEKK